MKEFLIVGPLVFLAGFIDSIAGGGGLISLPAYTMAGIPVHFAIGTNKFSSSFGAIMATKEYFVNKKVMVKIALFSASIALVGSYLGARLGLMMSDVFLKKLMIGVIPLMAAFLLTRKRSQAQVRELTISYPIAAVIAFLIGIYDGFLGPGTGSLLIFLYVSVQHMDYTFASGNAKVVNLASNLAALFAYIASGKVLFYLAIPAAVCSIVGSYFGSRYAIKHGSKIIRPVLIGTLSLLMIKLVFDVL